MSSFLQEGATQDQIDQLLDDPDACQDCGSCPCECDDEEVLIELSDDDEMDSTLSEVHDFGRGVVMPPPPPDSCPF